MGEIHGPFCTNGIDVKVHYPMVVDVLPVRVRIPVAAAVPAVAVAAPPDKPDVGVHPVRMSAEYPGQLQHHRIGASVIRPSFVPRIHMTAEHDKPVRGP